MNTKKSTFIMLIIYGAVTIGSSNNNTDLMIDHMQKIRSNSRFNNKTQLSSDNQQFLEQIQKHIKTLHEFNDNAESIHRNQSEILLELKSLSKRVKNLEEKSSMSFFHFLDNHPVLLYGGAVCLAYNAPSIGTFIEKHPEASSLAGFVYGLSLCVYGMCPSFVYYLLP